MPITPTEFSHVSRLVRADAGIVLEPGKEYLVEARLTPLARKEGYASLSALIAALTPGATVIRAKVVEAMTTNETSFFRDVEPFTLLRTTILPAVMEARRASRRIQIWCGASSTGQEPYSIAMTLLEMPELTTWSVDILATDLSTDVLDRARRGSYSQLEVNRGLPAPLLLKYFQKQGLEWQLHDRVRSMVRFEQLNLMRPLPLSVGSPDIVFLRNVLIYFDPPDKAAILTRIRNVMRPDGYLFLGAAETPRNLDDRFERVESRTGCYRIGSATPTPVRALA